jgi:hypothetical protein
VLCNVPLLHLQQVSHHCQAGTTTLQSQACLTSRCICPHVPHLLLQCRVCNRYRSLAYATAKLPSDSPAAPAPRLQWAPSERCGAQSSDPGPAHLQLQKQLVSFLGWLRDWLYIVKYNVKYCEVRFRLLLAPVAVQETRSFRPSAPTAATQHVSHSTTKQVMVQPAHWRYAQSSGPGPAHLQQQEISSHSEPDAR